MPRRKEGGVAKPREQIIPAQKHSGNGNYCLNPVVVKQIANQVFEGFAQAPQFAEGRSSSLNAAVT
jgi:hypothetical protein